MKSVKKRLAIRRQSRSPDVPLAPPPIAHTPNVVATPQHRPARGKRRGRADGRRGKLPCTYRLPTAPTRRAPSCRARYSRSTTPASASLLAAGRSGAASGQREGTRRCREERRGQRGRRKRRGSSRRSNRGRCGSCRKLGLRISGRRRVSRHRVRRWMGRFQRRRERLVESRPAGQSANRGARTQAGGNPQRTSPSAATSSFRRDNTTTSRCCWSIAKPAIRKSSASRGT